MNKNFKLIVGFAVFFCAGIYVFLSRSNLREIENRKKHDEMPKVASVKTEAPTNPIKNNLNNNFNEKPILPKGSEGTSGALLLDRNNFEDFIHRCFQGEDCELKDDPEKIYQYFKQSGKRDANDLFISFLRSKLKNAEFAKRYKDALKKMIDDFYPREELQFQQAAYYNYLGDLKKSLDIYLDLQKKAALDPSLRNAPNLNIANTYYDIGQYRQALPYYQLSRDEYINRMQEVRVPSQNEMIVYIEDRIRDIQSRLGL